MSKFSFGFPKLKILLNIQLHLITWTSKNEGRKYNFPDPKQSKVHYEVMKYSKCNIQSACMLQELNINQSTKDSHKRPKQTFSMIYC